MDRQTRIAFGLIFLLLIGYYFWLSRFSPEPESQPEQVQVESPVSSEPIETARSEALPPPPPPVREDIQIESGQAPRRHIVVETPLARYHLDSRGALVTRIEFPEFAGYDENGEIDGIAKLVDSGEGHVGDGLLGLDLFRDGSRMESADWNFACDLPEGRNTLQVDGEATLVFRFSDGSGGQLVKSFTFDSESYELDLRVSGRLGGAFAGVDAYGLELEQGILSTEKNRKDDIGSFKNFYKLGDNLEKKGLGNFKNGETVESPEGTVQWAATKNKYFMVALIPVESLQGSATLLGDKEAEYLGFRADFPLRGGREGFDEDFLVYTGPILREDLAAYGRGLVGVQDLGWAWIRPISVGIKWLMLWLYRFIPNYGVVIILLSVFTKVLFYRLSHKSFKSMKDMQALQPELQKIQEKHKDNKQKINEETMKLYKERGVNPLGGCLPLLLQMPVFFALFRVLRGAVELRGASFVGWIDDLSNMDVIYKLPFEIPMVGGFIENSIAVLPLLMGLSMWAQTKLGGSGMGTGPSGAAGQAAAMNKIMPIFMTVIFYRMPSGLVLYWLVNNILSVIQQYYIHKGSDDSGKVVPAEA